MKLWMSSETEASIADELRLASNALEGQLGSFLATKNYDLELDSFDCIIIIRNDDVFEEITRYSPKKRDMDFRLVIDFNSFSESDMTKRKSLILEALIRAADILATKKTINKKAIEELKKDLMNFGNDNGLLSI